MNNLSFFYYKIKLLLLVPVVPCSFNKLMKYFLFGFQNFDFEVDEKAMFVNYGMTICGEYTDIKLYNSAAVNSKVHNSIGIMQSNSYQWLMRSLDIAMQ